MIDKNDVPKLFLDASGWKTPDDVYMSFFEAVGAPAFHGRNFSALNDSISTGGINQIEVPYLLVIQHAACIAPGAQGMVERFVELIRELAVEGCPVGIQFEEDWGLAQLQSPLCQ